MFTRREWLAATTALTAWPCFQASAAPTRIPPPPAGAPDDEAFWSDVRDAFELTAERINLVTVVRGITTKTTREIAAAESARINTFRADGGPSTDWRVAVRRKAAAFIGAPVESVALLRNTTEGLATVVNNWPLDRGDELLTSSAEHGPYNDLFAARTARDGLTVRKFHYPAPATSSDAIAEEVERAMTPRTRLVMIGQVVLTGQITPVRQIADRVHARGAKLLVDGVLGIGHVPTDVAAMDCDFYAAGFHKWGCGPRATAVFYVRPGLVERLSPLFGGAHTLDEQGQDKFSWNAPTMNKYESFGAHPDPHFLALDDSLDFLSRIGVSRIQARLYALTTRWMTRAQRVPDFRVPVTLDPAHCAGLIAWELEGQDRARVRQVLVDHQVVVGGTERYAGFFGIPANQPRGLLIANAGIFTSPSEVDRLADAIEAAGRLRA